METWAGWVWVTWLWGASRAVLWRYGWWSVSSVYQCWVATSLHLCPSAGAGGTQRRAGAAPSFGWADAGRDPSREREDPERGHQGGRDNGCEDIWAQWDPAGTCQAGWEQLSSSTLIGDTSGGGEPKLGLVTDSNYGHRTASRSVRAGYANIPAAAWTVWRPAAATYCPLNTQTEGSEDLSSWILSSEHLQVTARLLWTLPWLWHGPETAAVPMLPSPPPCCHTVSNVFTVF